MSRSGYSEGYGDNESFPNAIELYRRAVDNAVAGKRGQAFFHELLVALDEMPVKELHKEVLVAENQVCAMGAVVRKRGLDTTWVNEGDPRAVGRLLGIARCLAAEIAYMNDEGNYGGETPAQCWTRMRDWAAQQVLYGKKRSATP